MIKKTISLLIAALAFVHASASNWQVVPSFLGSKTQNVVDMGDEVYYLVSGSLYRFDKSTKENESLNRANYLNDVVISNIYYNDYRGYLMVVYDNSNIDIITSEGDIINLPEIKAASLTQSKTINDVNFTPEGRVYLATDFGYVVLNDKKWEVLESRIFGQKVNSVAELGDYLLLSQDKDLRYGKVGKHYETVGSMPKVKGSVSNDGRRLWGDKRQCRWFVEVGVVGGLMKSVVAHSPERAVAAFIGAIHLILGIHLGEVGSGGIEGEIAVV